uniref:Uncharacterized protein n=1 Tax=Rhizophora mucronata TaxID=61149 RepID=A0A2P2QD21_RHIMU
MLLRLNLCPPFRYMWFACGPTNLTVYNCQ